MRFAFRTDSSHQIGTGHLIRCLTLSDELVRRGHQVFFLCRELPGNVAAMAGERGHGLAMLPAPSSGTEVHEGISPPHARWLEVSWEMDAAETAAVLKANGGPVDWLVVDHYALDNRWEGRLQDLYTRLMVIDDLADRLHRADILLDQNLYDNLERRYCGLVPESCRTLLGPRFVLLRPEFAEARSALRQRDGRVRRVLVFFGGIDADNETLKALEALMMVDGAGIIVDVIIGRSNPNLDLIRRYCEARPELCLHVQTQRVAELMVAADIAIGAGGAATWERCAVGLPALVVALAYNQVAIAEELEAEGAIRYLGKHRDVQREQIEAEFRTLLTGQERLAAMSRSAISLVDGLGLVRVADAMETGV